MVNWLEPLLDRVQMNNGMVVSPILDNIYENNTIYKPNNPNFRAGFDWNFNFHWIPMTEVERELRGDDIPSPFL